MQNTFSALDWRRFAARKMRKRAWMKAFVPGWKCRDSELAIERVVWKDLFWSRICDSYMPKTDADDYSNQRNHQRHEH